MTNDSKLNKTDKNAKELIAKKPMTANERKRKSRADKMDSGCDQLSCYIKKETMDKIALFADSNGLTQGEALDKMLS